MSADIERKVLRICGNDAVGRRPVLAIRKIEVKIARIVVALKVLEDLTRWGICCE
ncbi:hypothetical protein P615_22265 [Brevibacillus laterosporus PE36]|nr:hypothetical protein P615_22265 [Brevibacillus laterosporus PE36]